MKKVLLIAFSYPPFAGMGMLRSLKFAKYLPAFGWQPIVLTIEAPIKVQPSPSYWFCDAAEGDLPQVEVIRTKHASPNLFLKSLMALNFFRRKETGGVAESKAGSPVATHKYLTLGIKRGLISLWNDWLLFPDNAVGWYPYAVKGAMTYLRDHSVDVIFSTSLPMTSHLIANTLSRKTGIPWVADFRDPWSQGHYRETSRLRNRIDKCLETKTVKSASALITVSEPLREEFLKIHRTFSQKSFVIYNGYDADDYSNPERSVKRPMTITFTGRMYEIDFSSKGRTPSILFQSMAILFRDGRIPSDHLQCHIYGEYPRELTEMIAAYGLEKVVKCLGALPFREAIKAQQDADALLLLSWADGDRKGILTGKIFEYLGAKKPILAVPYYNQGVDDILTTTRTGVTVTSVQTCIETLWAWYRDFDTRGFLPYHGIPEVIEIYSRKKATEQLAAILNQVSRSR